MLLPGLPYPEGQRIRGAHEALVAGEPSALTVLFTKTGVGPVKLQEQLFALVPLPYKVKFAAQVLIKPVKFAQVTELGGHG